MEFHQLDQLHIMGVPGRKERKNGEKILFKEIMSENFPNLMKDMNQKPQESQKIACKK